MANPEHLAVLKQGVKAWNLWRKDSGDTKPDLAFQNFSFNKLSGANLSNTLLTGASFVLADLTRANLNNANLSQTVLTGADLNYANLERVNLHEANLSKANLRGAFLRFANLVADLSGANLSDANLTDANLNGAVLAATDFTNAKFGYSVLGGLDLSQAKSLETAEHLGPSTIGIDTLIRSKGDISEVFLRGCGVPKPFITNMKSLIGAMDPIQFYSCFISYSKKDQDFADRLHADLHAKGVRCWFAPHDVQGGRKLHEQIDEAIRLHDKLLLILSPHSMASEWVMTEISKARKREVRDKARVLFPISLVPFEAIRDWEAFDADIGKDSAREVREYFIPDFSRWKDHNSYQQAFDRLMRDLKATQPVA